jgi:hypothetical protein
MYKSQTKSLKVRYRGPVLVYGDTQRAFNHQSRVDMVKHVQLYGHTRYQSFEKPLFNTIQQRLYSEAVYGLSLYNQEQLLHLSRSKKHDILVVFKKAQVVLNTFKQQVINTQVNSFFEKLFPKSQISRLIVSTEVDPGLKCKLSFKELGINQQMIADKLIQSGILPRNFYELT